MRIDLHSHSARSDGTDPPAILIQNAVKADLDVVALTDHDTFAGWDEATAEAARQGIGLVLGAEMSCRLDGASVHLLAYLPDRTNPGLVEEFARIQLGRNDRIPETVDQLRAQGVDITVADVFDRVGPGGSPGRPHVADVLVAKGYVADRREAFDTWLMAGRPGHVTRYAPSPRTAIELVVAAGGVPVLAHSRGRGSRILLTDEVIASLVPFGLAGLEVDHHDHDPLTRMKLRALAADLDLIVTGSSDHHGLGKVDHDLGSETTTPDQFERLLAVAAENARAAGAQSPGFPAS